MTLRELFTYRVVTISNVLTLSRVILVPALVLLLYWAEEEYYYNHYASILVLFMVATDFFDGYLARLLGQETPLGQYLDPVADKIAILAGLTLLWIFKDYPTWLVAFVLVREILGTIGGTLLLLRYNILGKPNYWGKLGVALVALSGMAYLTDWPYKVWTTYPVAFVFAGSIVAYAIKYWRTFFETKKG